MNRYELKKNAKEQLGNGIFHDNWLLAVVSVLAMTAITGLAGSILPAVGVLLISGPLTYGLNKMFLKQARDGQKMTFTDLFSGFKEDFGQIFLLGLLMSIFIFLWSLLLIVPGIIMSYAYSMAFYIKADHPEYDWRRCLEESKTLTYGHKWDLFVLDLSFIGWAIVGALCLGVGTLWVNAWMMAAKAQAYNVLAENPVNIAEAEYVDVEE